MLSARSAMLGIEKAFACVISSEAGGEGRLSVGFGAFLGNAMNSGTDDNCA